MSADAAARDALQRRLHALEADAALPALPDEPLPDEALRDLVVILSSSRGGSSILAEALRRQTGLLHFRAEVNPFFVMAGLSCGQGGARSDALGEADLQRAPEVRALRRALLADIGRPRSTLPDAAARRRYGLDLARRFTLQWPTLELELEGVHAALERALDAAARAQRGGDGGGERGGEVDLSDPRLVVALVIRELRGQGLPIHPYAYDIDPGLLRALFPGVLPRFEPEGPIIEEPPYVAISPWAPATAEELQRLPVVMKTPSNVYRLPFLAGLFPEARLRLLHLRRNVASSVNGLLDGWGHPGFHSHRLGGPGGAEGWWKFDLPPGWEAWVDAPPGLRCAWQWRSAHRAALEFLRQRPDLPRFALRFEDLLRGGEVEAAAVEALAGWLGAPLSPGLLDGVPAVMATAPPRRRRWFARAAELGPVLEDPDNIRMMEELGYESELTTWL